MSSEADKHKALGNEAFKAKNFDEAIRHFSDAIAVDPSGHVLYSNRSASYASLGRFAEALEDASECVNLSPSWVKGYSRKGAALVGLGRFEEAVETYEAGLAQEPGNATLQDGLRDAKAHIGGAGGGAGGGGGIGNVFGDPSLFAKIAGNPQTMPFLQQPDFVAKMQELQRDPSKINEHLNDPRVLQVVGVLMGVNIQTPGGAGSGFADGESMPQPPAPATNTQPDPEPEPMEEELTEEEKAAREVRREADGHKEKGNEAYRAKRFEEAIEHYTKAKDTLPTEMTYHNNLAAVYFEQKEYAKTVETCREAVKLGREQHADWKVIAKAFAREGNAHVKLEDLESAIKAYENSLLENRTDDVEKRLKAAKKALTEKQSREYISEELAVQEREKGNALFKAGKYPEAIDAYTEAMRRNPADHVPYSNRAACYQKLMEWVLALNDCNKCIEMCPTFVKAWTRKGGLHFHLKELHKALDAYNKALELDPNSEEAKAGVENTVASIGAASSEEEQQQRAQRALADPEIQAIMQDPTMRKVLSDMQQDPKSMAEYMRDQTIKSNLEKLVAAGVLAIK